MSTRGPVFPSADTWTVTGECPELNGYAETRRLFRSS